MIENQIEIHDKSTVKRTYLQLAKTGKVLPVLMSAAAIVCAAAWFFFGQTTVCVTGYCEPAETKAVFMMPMYYRNQVEVGDTIWVGNYEGTVKNLYEESYFTYSDISNSEDIVFRDFVESGKCDESISYILGNAVFEDDIAGMTEYRIVVDTTTPFQRFIGVDDHE